MRAINIFEKSLREASTSRESQDEALTPVVPQ